MNNLVSEKYLLLEIKPILTSFDVELVKSLLLQYRPEDIADIFWDMLNYTNMIQLETSKGLYGADENIMSINKTSAVNPLVREAIGLVYIRSYLKDFMPKSDSTRKMLNWNTAHN